MIHSIAPPLTRLQPIMWALFFLLFLVIGGAQCQGSYTFKEGAVVQDEETQAFFQELAHLFLGEEGKEIHIHLVIDPSLNAFTPGLNEVFFHTGLLLHSSNPQEIAGVFAHELGHIQGRHMLRKEEGVRRTQAARVGASLGGILLAGALGGAPGALAGVMAAGDTWVKAEAHQARGLEGAADRAGFAMLERAQISAQGISKLMEELKTRELLSRRTQDPYLRSHPLTQDRVKAIDHHLKTSRYTYAPFPEALAAAFSRIQAKLAGYVYPLSKILVLYPLSNQDIPAHYARAVAYLRMGELSRAEAEIQSLLQALPDDPYFLYLFGILKLNQRQVGEAIRLFERALVQNPEDGEILFSLIQCLLIEGSEASLDRALTLLRPSLSVTEKNPGIFILAAKIYGRQGDLASAKLMQAEAEFRSENYKEAVGLARLAQKGLEGPDLYRAQDLEHVAQDEKKREEERMRYPGAER